MNNQKIEAQLDEKCRDLQDFAKRNGYANLIVFTPRIDIEKVQQPGKVCATPSVWVTGNLLEVFCMMSATLSCMEDITGLSLNTLIDKFGNYAMNKIFTYQEGADDYGLS